MRFTPSLFLVAAGLATSTFVACHKSEADQPAASAPSAATPVAAAPGTQNAIQGTVLEILPASPYSYLKIKASQGEVWAAVPAADLKVGAAVTVLVQLKMDKFESKTLARTFDTVYMGTLGGAAPAAPAAAAVPAAVPAPASAMPAAHGAVPFPAVGNVAKAAGPDGHRISELYAKRKDLKDRTVAVKGKVTKAMSGIMGKTWLHLSDGSGQQQTRDFDLTVTTLEAAKVGEVVTVKGVLHLDRDFGSGYVYPVILEDAKVSR